LIALIIGKLTGARVVVEVNGNFETAFKFDQHNSWFEKFEAGVKEKLSLVFISFVLKRATVVRLLYKDQLQNLDIRNKENMNLIAFSNFVPINLFLQANKTDGNYILAMGHPFFLKGFDLLIQAFNKITDEFPQYRLIIVGHNKENREYYEELKANNSKIEIHKPMLYEDVVKMMTGCSLFVLPSRTEAMGRVLLEAMASKKPIVASNVCGIPNVIHHEKNGLLFESENIPDLTEKLRYMLSNPDIAAEFADNGQRYVRENLSEQRYIDNFFKIVQSVL
jgi:glycosyltransferase involved in cell wall biosynthesis